MLEPPGKARLVPGWLPEEPVLPKPERDDGQSPGEQEKQHVPDINGPPEEAGEAQVLPSDNCGPSREEAPHLLRSWERHCEGWRAQY